MTPNIQCRDINQPDLPSERRYLANSWPGPFLRLGFFIPAGFEGGKPVIRAVKEPSAEGFIHQQRLHLYVLKFK